MKLASKKFSALAKRVAAASTRAEKALSGPVEDNIDAAVPVVQGRKRYGITKVLKLRTPRIRNG